MQVGKNDIIERERERERRATPMSFYNVLTSNVAPGTYPKNTASEYSTPLTVPYNLQGKWQAAMTSISYSGCFNTFFETNTITVTKKLASVDDLKAITSPVRIDLPPKTKTIMGIAKLLSITLAGILEVKHINVKQEFVEGSDYFS